MRLFEFCSERSQINLSTALLANIDLSMPTSACLKISKSLNSMDVTTFSEVWDQPHSKSLLLHWTPNDPARKKCQMPWKRFNHRVYLLLEIYLGNWIICWKQTFQISCEIIYSLVVVTAVPSDDFCATVTERSTRNFDQWDKKRSPKDFNFYSDSIAWIWT